MISDNKKESKSHWLWTHWKKAEAYVKSDGFTKSAIIELALENYFQKGLAKIDNKKTPLVGLSSLLKLVIVYHMVKENATRRSDNIIFGLVACPMISFYETEN